MLIRFFFALRVAGLKPSLTEFLALLEALRRGVADTTIDDFYLLARTCLVKDETRYDLYDRVFGAYFKGVTAAADELYGSVPEEWLRRQAELMLTDEEKAKIKALGGFEELMQALKDRLAEQQGRHQGGNRWIGTGGTSPFGNAGYNPQGVRIGGASRNRSAVKVWEQRQYRNLDDQIELGTRNIKVALRQLRRFARSGAADELDLDGTIRETARNAGWLDLKFRPERHNAVKVLLFLDIGGSMDDHIRVCEELFSAAKTEFKHLEHFYFHNFLYERVWKDNSRRYTDTTSTMDILHKYAADYRVVFVGDACMSPYEIVQAGGSVEHWNEEPGSVWMKRLTDVYPRTVWLNPMAEDTWGYHASIDLTRQLLGDRMYPMTLAGLGKAIEKLRHA
jgi:hypothetical protein